MNWINCISQAINYIEKNLTNDLTIDDVSKEVYSSAPHFQQVFHLITGITVGDYIRSRRLSLAGQDLLQPDSKISDIAALYRYETQEGFSKAFSRFHGIPPSTVRKQKDKLKFFLPFTINLTIQGGFNAIRKIIDNLPLDIPFSGFSGTTFINCFATVYMFLENEIAKHSNTPNQIQERYFMLFDTMCGRSSLRCRYDDVPTEMQKLICETDFYDAGTENNIDFLFGFAGYEYQNLDNPDLFKAAVIASIDAGKPVIAKAKEKTKRFRVIVGYDGDTLVSPYYVNAQNQPEAPTYDNIAVLYVFGGKVTPRYTILDGLKRIQQVMSYNIAQNLWGTYTDKLGTYKGFFEADLEEKKSRIKRVAATMWHVFNCHNFRETFCFYGNRPEYNIPGAEKLQDPALMPLWQKIDGYPNSYNHTHDIAWGLIALDSCAEWPRNEHAANYFGPLAENTICQIAKNDETVLECIEKAIEILEGENSHGIQNHTENA